MVDVKRATTEIAKLSLLKFFPSDAMARLALVEMVCGFSESNIQIEWLVKRALVVFNEWPGPHELRALFCSRWKPRDGNEAYSAIYPATESGGGFPRDPALPPASPAFTPIGREEARKLLGMAAKEIKGL